LTISLIEPARTLVSNSCFALSPHSSTEACPVGPVASRAAYSGSSRRPRVMCRRFLGGLATYSSLRDRFGRALPTALRVCCAGNVVTASEGREPRALPRKWQSLDRAHAQSKTAKHRVRRQVSPVTTSTATVQHPRVHRRGIVLMNREEKCLTPHRVVEPDLVLDPHCDLFWHLCRLGPFG
jgi:hypothetical protein